MFGSVRRNVFFTILAIFLTLIVLECTMRFAGFIFFTLYHSEMGLNQGNADTVILCLGESTTDFGGTYSWPRQLETILNKRNLNKSFKVINGGRGGTNTAFILLNLEKNLADYKPDIVITMMGINDVWFHMIYKDTLRSKLFMQLKNFRLYKLVLILQSYIKDELISNDFKKLLNNETEYNKSLEINSNLDKDRLILYQFYRNQGVNYFFQGRFNEAEDAYRKALKIRQYDENGFIDLGICYYQQGKFKEAENAYQKALKINPNNEKIYLFLGAVYRKQNRLEESERMYNKAIQLNSTDLSIYDNLIWTFFKLNLSINEIENFYNKVGFSFELSNVKSGYEMTKYHYQKLYQILHKKGIKLIAMQYPLRDVNELKAMFNGSEDIIFVDNEKNFKKALASGRYEDYFVDRFAKEFGHATPKGNNLIAQNLADVILNITSNFSFTN